MLWIDGSTPSVCTTVVRLKNDENDSRIAVVWDWLGLIMFVKGYFTVTGTSCDWTMPKTTLKNMDKRMIWIH